MSRLERLLMGILVLIGLLLAGWFGVQHYGAEQYKAGQVAAVAAGEKLRQAEADRNHKTESDLRDQLRIRDANALQKEQEYASNLETAQRRVRAGTDRLRCPAAGPVPETGTSGAGPATSGPHPDTAGPAVMPEAAADLLGIASDVAGLVRRYDRLVERFEACRAVNSR